MKLICKVLADKIQDTNVRKLTILASMLDWGLGHTTRSIPILKAYIEKGHDLIIAGTQLQVSLLSAEIPGASFHIINGYGIRYSRYSKLFAINLLFQLPRIIVSIRREWVWVKQFTKHQHVDLVFSDNRPGFRAKGIRSIYMTHQLNLQTGNRITGKLSSKLHAHFIKKFDECWVPDDAMHTLSGELSNIQATTRPTKFIGPLSRFEPLDRDKAFDLAIILSGPEPQRTILENRLLLQLTDTTLKTVLVRGLPSDATHVATTNPGITIKNHLDSSALNLLICRARLVICRAGYTSIMDLVKTRSKAVLIPTPGQGEQEYLAKYLHEKRFFVKAEQTGFSVMIAWETYRKFEFETANVNFEQYKGAIDKSVTTT